METSVGSTWSKWDLHVHTPKSLEQQYGGDAEEVWRRFVADLEALPPEFKVIGVNDYLFVDGYEKLLAYKQSGRLGNIDLLLPVVELRLDKFGGVVKKEADGTYSASEFSRINLHVIFDQLDPQLIREQFLAALSSRYALIPEREDYRTRWQAIITPASLAQLGQMIIDAAPEPERRRYSSPLREGFNNLCVSFDAVEQALTNHNLKGRCLMAVGKAEWDTLRWTDGSIAEKRNLINRAQLVFTAAANDAAYARGRKRLSDAGVNDRLLDCSDAHTFSDAEHKDRIGNCQTWIKAERTFKGLRQAVHEFDQRVFIGDRPPKRTLVNANRTKFATRLSVKKKTGSVLADNWFDIDIPLNHDLVAVIGNKGSGKSALTDILALAGDTKNYGNFSFLNLQRFRNPKANLAAHFEGTITWADGTTSSAYLDRNPDAARVERVKYLPQSYLETLCNELAGAGSEKFDGELRQIIFSHVPQEERLGKATLDELLDFKIAELDKAGSRVKERLTTVNAEVASIEAKMSDQHRRGLEAQLGVKREELSALDSAKPPEVPNPRSEGEPTEDARRDASEMGDLETRLAAVTTEEQELRDGRGHQLRLAAHLTRVVQAVRNYEARHAEFLEHLGAMLVEVGVDIDPRSIVSLTVNTAEIERRILDTNTQAAALQERLSGTSDDAVLARRAQIEASLGEVRGRLSERERRYVEYQERLVQWEASRVALLGDDGKPTTIRGLEALIAQLDQLPTELEAARARRRDLVRERHANLKEIVAEYQKLYAPVRQFLQSPERQQLSLELDFKVRIVESGFRERFLDNINRNVRGTFSGIDESVALITQCMEETDFENVEAVLHFLDKLDDMLHVDRRPTGAEAAVSVTSQLRRGYTVSGLYDVLFGLDYLSPQYSLTFNAQEISQLSPGERGLLLLVFYLLVDKDNIPLVIDQPEENLDNQTIFHILVKCIKAAKQRRQIVMVTHNPNLAVVCDAEQVIGAMCDKTAKQFTYRGGAIENGDINLSVVEVLEGTEPAFVNRKTKYGL